jgi:hypothetical protein
MQTGIVENKTGSLIIRSQYNRAFTAPAGCTLKAGTMVQFDPSGSKAMAVEPIRHAELLTRVGRLFMTQYLPNLEIEERGLLNNFGRRVNDVDALEAAFEPRDSKVPVITVWYNPTNSSYRAYHGDEASKFLTGRTVGAAIALCLKHLEKEHLMTLGPDDFRIDLLSLSPEDMGGKPEGPIIEVCERKDYPGHFGARTKGDLGTWSDEMHIDDAITKILDQLRARGFSGDRDDYTIVLLSSRDAF